MDVTDSYRSLFDFRRSELALLFAIDRELRHNAGVTLAEAALVFTRQRQIFASSAGSLIDQTRYTSGAGFSAYSFHDGEIQKRSYPNSFGGQHQLKGYELVEELKLLGERPTHRGGSGGAAFGGSVSGGALRFDSR